MSNAEEQADRLIAFLLKNKEDRGVMADLRCGFSPAKEHRAWPHIAQLCNLEKDWSRIPVQTVCAAFATHPEHTDSGNIGSTMREIAKEMASEEKRFPRFQRLLACGTQEELCDHLSSVVRMAKAKGIPVNYRQMYCDICWWEVSDIKVRWASSFWGVAGGEE
jgi:CRISPR system Cascade subunit CasB